MHIFHSFLLLRERSVSVTLSIAHIPLGRAGGKVHSTKESLFSIKQ